jgi:hypothetical protein
MKWIQHTLEIQEKFCNLLLGIASGFGLIIANRLKQTAVQPSSLSQNLGFYFWLVASVHVILIYL